MTLYSETTDPIIKKSKFAPNSGEHSPDGTPPERARAKTRARTQTMRYFRYRFSRLGILVTLVALLAAPACSSDDAEGSMNADGPRAPGENNNNGVDQEPGGGSDNGASDEDDYVPEQEEDFEFSAPAVVGERVYVANETLNSVAVIDSRNLSITTRLVGFRPTEIVGPDAQRADAGEDARVMVLNEGSHSVSILASGVVGEQSGEVKTVKVMANANQIAMVPTGTSALVWYDPSKAEAGAAAGDLSSVSVVRNGESFQVSVGFHVRSVAFDDAGSRALVLSDDGLSVIELAQVSEDAIALPMAVVPDEFSTTQPEDLEVLMTRDGKWAITRSATFRGVVLLDIDSGVLHFMAMPEVPTDIDLIEGDALEVLIMLRNAKKAVRATVPDGFRDAAEVMTSVMTSEVIRMSDMMSIFPKIPVTPAMLLTKMSAWTRRTAGWRIAGWRIAVSWRMPRRASTWGRATRVSLNSPVISMASRWSICWLTGWARRLFRPPATPPCSIRPSTRRSARCSMTCLPSRAMSGRNAHWHSKKACAERCRTALGRPCWSFTPSSMDPCRPIPRRRTPNILRIAGASRWSTWPPARRALCSASMSPARRCFPRRNSTRMARPSKTPRSS